ncbi:hypothetical protein AB0O14_19275 [Microbacterium foliorum]|uniref:hypothetical protein n=1 Tax=Rothia terrae TaxID=396015 RepID=UPI0014461A53|nr:hypothetical protein [Rothia terrae]MDT0190801.1 hypothetical protein [Rothia terrae]NKZ35300.1 hypothetical protein [Rothia terrae]
MDSSVERIEKLEERISDLEGLIQSLVVSVQFNSQEPFEAECAKRMITGHKRSALQMQIGIMLRRKNGQDIPRYPDSLFPQYPSVLEATRGEYSTQEEMAKALVPLVGSEETASVLLDAYQQRGLGSSF